jgi:hypothetical protein
MRLIFLSLAFLCFFFSGLHADVSPEEKSVVVLSANEVYEGNYFACGTSVEISGTVNGDVYIFAEQVVVDGTINGDLLCCGGSVDVSGKVLHNCRMAGGQILISGTVGNQVTAVAGNLQLLPSATVGGSLVAVAANSDLAAGIGSDVTLIASNVRLSSHIRKGVQGLVGNLRVTSRALIGGDLDYRSSNDAWIEPGATILGAVIHQPSFVHEFVKGTWIHKFLVGSRVLAVLMNFLYTFVVGVFLVKMFSKNLESALHVLKEQPLKSLVAGIMLLVLLPLVALILLMTILGVPFALTLVATTIIGFYTAKVYSIFWMSNWLFGKVGLKPNRLPLFFCGTVLYFCLTVIPVFGLIVAFAAMLFGLGAGVLAQTRRGGLFNSP